MTSSRNIQPGDIWLAYLHFSDMPARGKVRPVLIVAAEEELEAVALKITSKDYFNPAIALKVDHWEDCGLRVPSFVRIDQVFQVPDKDILREERLGSVGAEFFEKVNAARNDFEKSNG